MGKLNSFVKALRQVETSKAIAKVANSQVQYGRAMLQAGKTSKVSLGDALNLRRSAGKAAVSIGESLKDAGSIHDRINARVAFRRIGGRIVPIRGK